jgi:hypothetical protein
MKEFAGRKLLEISRRDAASPVSTDESFADLDLLLTMRLEKE